MAGGLSKQVETRNFRRQDESSARTTQTCSACEQKRTTELTLKEREWTCEHCGTHHDRDVNAAKNILARGVALFESAQTAQNVQNEQQGNDVRVASSGEDDYTSGWAIFF